MDLKLQIKSKMANFGEDGHEFFIFHKLGKGFGSCLTIELEQEVINGSLIKHVLKAIILIGGQYVCCFNMGDISLFIFCVTKS